ncbi:MAG: recombinase family protein [Armatimonadetes bacterium]|nr:recombinase family protein [Armatimonadota bacterium]MBX3107809.1 recombinase family protein [Fimbriimonadaceae bacterium]
MKLPHVAIYRRVSTKTQVDDGISLENQPELVLNELDRRFGSGAYTYELFTDEGKSGGAGPKPWQDVRRPKDRVGLFDMIQRLKSNEFTHVAAYHLDRIYRDYTALNALFTDIMQPRNVDFIFVACHFESSNEGLFAQGVIAGVAELQRKQTKENVKRHLDLKRQNGFFLGGAPFGWRRESQEECGDGRPNIVPIPEQARIVQSMVDMYLSGAGFKELARKFNLTSAADLGFEKIWQYQTIRNALTCPTHAGLIRQSDGTLQRGLHYKHRLYDEEVYDQITEKMMRNRRRLRGPASSQPFRMFVGLAYCGHCGKRLQSDFSGKYGAYRCFGQKASDDGSHVYISSMALESLMLAELTSIARDPTMQAKVEIEIEKLICQQDIAFRKRHADVSKAIEDNEKKADRVIDAIAKGVVANSIARRTLKQYELEHDELLSEQRSLEANLAASMKRRDIATRAKAALAQFTDIWQSLTDSERREAFHIVIERIDVHVKEHRKWLVVQLAFQEEPIEIEVLRGAERYRSGKLDGIASLTPRELAALKHLLDGASHIEICEYFGTTRSNVVNLLSRARDRLGAKSHLEAAKTAEPLICRVAWQLPLYGSCSPGILSRKQLKVMEYHILCLAAEGKSDKVISALTGVDHTRVAQLLESALKKLERRTAKSALKRLNSDDRYLPQSMVNRKRYE